MAQTGLGVGFLPGLDEIPATLSSLPIESHELCTFYCNKLPRRRSKNRSLRELLLQVFFASFLIFHVVRVYKRIVGGSKQLAGCSCDGACMKKLHADINQRLTRSQLLHSLAARRSKSSNVLLEATVL